MGHAHSDALGNYDAVVARQVDLHLSWMDESARLGRPYAVVGVWN